MSPSDFEKLVNEVCDEVKQVLVIKGKEYADEVDRLRNFYDAGDFIGEEPEKALLGFVSKHIIALKDFINDLDNNVDHTAAQWNEKTGDIINYMILLRGLLRDRGVL